ncbi:MAG: Ig-like domain-containing protein [Bacteroidales bacterium]|nr:Ig-like domain-containing protein [Bacteroidales bacterium]
MRLRSAIICSALLLCAASCARQGYPTGGPKDVTPPQTTTMQPPSGTLNFADKEFFIGFDEYVTVKDADNNILISPPMKVKPEYTPKGHGLRVRLRDTLQPATTYLFQFKGAIVDFNEGNALPSLEYVFSTGSTIDSMAIAGRVVDAETARPRKETITVAAFRIEATDTVADSLAMTTQPTYITRCDTAGNFALNHIKTGRYHIVALDDGDKNLRLGPTEAMAFADSIIEPHHMTDSSQQLSLNLSGLAAQSRQRLTRSGFVTPGHIQLIAANPLVAPTVEADSAVWRLGVKRDTVNIWTLNPEQDSATIVVSDSSGIADTLRLKYRGRPRPRNAKPETPQNFVKQSIGTTMRHFDTLRIVFDKPATRLRQADSALTIMRLSDSTLEHHSLTLGPDSMWATVDFVPLQGENYSATLAPRTVADLYGRWNDTLRFHFKSTRAEDFGNIKLRFNPNIERHGNHFVVQLLNEKNVVVAQEVADGPRQIVFANLAPGSYRLRTIVDRDADHQWTPGHYPSRRQPEPIIVYPKTLELRANWDIEENLDI